MKNVREKPKNKIKLYNHVILSEAKNLRDPSPFELRMTIVVLFCQSKPQVVVLFFINIRSGQAGGTNYRLTCAIKESRQAFITPFRFIFSRVLNI